ncbi:cytochrome c [bacterium]|nr:cytochrome c [Rhodospirillales bacterium]MBN9518924.1 cytochrome c [bacterium]
MTWKSLALLIGLAGAAAGGGVIYLRVHGLSARAKPSAVEEWAARHVRDLATPPSVKAAVNPVRPTEFVLAEARDHFADHCATCHGNRGDGRTMIGDGLFPPPPDLRAEATQRLTDGEIMNIIRNGIRFTGMPGFGGSDEDNWKLTHFVRHLPSLSERERALMNEINNLEGKPNDHDH